MQTVPFLQEENPNGQENDQTPEHQRHRNPRHRGDPDRGKYCRHTQRQGHRVPQRETGRQIARYRPDPHRQRQDQTGPVQLSQPGQVRRRPELGRQHRPRGGRSVAELPGLPLDQQRRHRRLHGPRITAQGPRSIRKSPNFGWGFSYFKNISIYVAPEN